MDYRIGKTALKLIDSYLVPKAGYDRELDAIRKLHPECPVWERSRASLKREIAVHNLAYALGYKRGRTKDCDLNYTHKWYVKLAYGVVGTIALWVIK